MTVSTNPTQEEINKIAEAIRIAYTHSKDMVRKVRVNLYVNERLRELAEEFGLNLSSFLEIKLFEHFRELLLINGACGGRDLNPRTPTGRDPEGWA